MILSHCELNHRVSVLFADLNIQFKSFSLDSGNQRQTFLLLLINNKSVNPMTIKTIVKCSCRLCECDNDDSVLEVCFLLSLFSVFICVCVCV